MDGCVRVSWMGWVLRLVALCAMTPVCHGAGVEIYVDDLWLTDQTNIELRVTDLMESDRFDIETIADLVNQAWATMYRYEDGVGIGYGFGFGYSATFGYGYAHGYGGYLYRPLFLWSASYTQAVERVFYRIRTW